MSTSEEEVNFYLQLNSVFPVCSLQNGDGGTPGGLSNQQPYRDDFHKISHHKHFLLFPFSCFLKRREQ